MSRPIRALIHADALRHNYGVAKSLAPHSRVFAVVKAQAYGHGLMTAAAAFGAVDGFAILEIEGARSLRAAGYTQPILLLEGAFSLPELRLASELDLWLTVHDEAGLARLEAETLPRPVAVFAKLNSGMNRLGFPAEEVATVVARLRGNANVGEITLMTHFATADEPARGITGQLARFEAAIGSLALPVTVANSAALIAYPEARRDWVRPGIMLYGSSPFAHTPAAELGLQAAMTLQSEIISVQRLQPGDTVGYGASFVAARAMTIGIVACGYADGYPRHAGTGTPVLVDGMRTRLVGRVSMDMLAIELTDVPGVGVGSAVELWGQQLPIDVVAAAAGTIGYELMCAISPRVPVQVV
ncbi:alanine racemase [Chitinolyticbacter albus]|uniref:alanine racemase n=1 Tax=Chitinolyticbacter albus TaxID=2961951 RepID=UPI00210E9DD5|nr:alanine racemase [Chitinolyticbacter albus]